jgi:hypothetical protein
MITATLLKRKWLLPPKRQTMVFVLAMVEVVTGRRQIKKQLPLFSPASDNPVSCRRKNCPDP